LIRVLLHLDAKDCLSYIEVNGHAGYGKKGEDIVCAAATALVRTAAHVVSGQKQLMSATKAPDTGIIQLRLDSYPDQMREWVKGISDFLLTGFSDLKSDYPQNIDIKLEVKHGS
jgi:uncharacterized protein YsxB (DUF464 family)